MCNKQINGECWCEKFLNRYRGLDTIVNAPESKGYNYKYKHVHGKKVLKKIGSKVVNFDPNKFEYGEFENIKPTRYLSEEECNDE